MKKTLLHTAILAAAILVAPAAKAATVDITDTPHKVRTTPLASGATLVRLSFDLQAWPANQTLIVRHCCPPGVEMRSQGFSPLKLGSNPIFVRQAMRLTNARNLPGDNGEECFSWDILNDGPSSGPVRLEISFVAKRVAPAP